MLNLFFISKLEGFYKDSVRQLQKNSDILTQQQIDIKEEEINYIHNQYGKFILIWESILTTSSIMLFYLILSRHLEKEKKQREFLEIMILTISHKFGNFISALKVNLEIIKSAYSEKAISNMDRYVSDMNDELQVLIDILKKAQNKEEEEKETIQIKEFIQHLIDKLNTKDKKLLIQLKDQKVKVNKNMFENVLFILLHNSFSYSKRFIHIKMLKDKTIVIRNDIEKKRGGSGIGLTLAEKFCSLNGWYIKIRRSKNYFTVFFNPF